LAVVGREVGGTVGVWVPELLIRLFFGYHHCFFRRFAYQMRMFHTFIHFVLNFECSRQNVLNFEMFQPGALKHFPGGRKNTLTHKLSENPTPGYFRQASALVVDLGKNPSG
jgi:hypothetical protein